MNDEYKMLVRKILACGEKTECRNGKQLILPTYSFTLDFRLQSHFLTLRKMHYAGVLGEFKTLIAKEQLTNVQQFRDNGCNYWGSWAADDGSLNLDYYNKLHPQLEDIIVQIKTDPTSRRHVVNLWDHENVKDGSLSLPCCWFTLIFTVIKGILHLNWIQRSVDTMVGLPADIYLAYLFMNHVAIEGQLEIGTCMFSLSNVHIYEEHINKAHKLLARNHTDSNKPLTFELKA